MLWVDPSDGKPLDWDPTGAPEEMQRDAIAGIQRILGDKLLSFLELKMRDEHWKSWSQAYGQSGSGSGRRRAYEIEAIFDQCAPLLGQTPDELSHQLIQEIRQLVRESIEQGKGKISGLSK